jgi:LytS/YehU family sensor histidine kinase
MLYESNSNETSFEKENEIMQAYIDLELLRITKKNGLQFHIESDKDYNIPPLLWVPVLENIFKHGTRFISKEYNIEYRFIIHQGSLSIYSKNTFKQANAENEIESEKKGGIGLDNLKKRLALLFPGKHVLYSGKEDDYFITNVLIQLA